MATLPVIPQPELRPYIVYDALPAGCISHVVTERSCPLLHQGEMIVVDTADRSIEIGDLFVMESGRNSPRGPARSVVEFTIRNLRIVPRGEEPRDADCWIALFYSEAVNCGTGKAAPIRFMDGPILLEEAGYFEDRIIGRVVGILEPKFEEPMRRVAQ